MVLFIKRRKLQSLFLLNSIFDTVASLTTDKIKHFDLSVAPILNYSSEVLGFHNANQGWRNLRKSYLSTDNQT